MIIVNKSIAQTVLLVSALALAGCAATPGGEETEDELGPEECPAWKIAVIVNERVECVDEDVLEREREIIEDEEHW